MYLRVVDAYYTEETDGYRATMPVVHVLGRDTNFERRHVAIDEFRPYFCVRVSEWAQIGTDIEADDRVLRVETTDHRDRPEQALDGESLVRVICRTPEAVGKLRDLVDDPMEADVLFPVRHLVDVGAYQWLHVPDAVADEHTEIGTVETPLSVEHVTIAPDEKPERTPPLRVCTYDIEVLQGGGGPPVVSERGTEQARNPITAICAHDSYTDEYRLWILAADSWTAGDSQRAVESVTDSDDGTDVDVSVYGTPQNVVASFVQWVRHREMDALVGWNANSFDHPYLVNYALRNGINAIKNLSPTRDVYQMNGDGRWINGSLKGRLLLALLSMYQKTEVHELDSYRLADVAEAEGVSVGKLDIEDELAVPEDEPAIDYAWTNDPATFVEYSLRDVQATVAINSESKTNTTIV